MWWLTIGDMMRGIEQLLGAYGARTADVVREQFEGKVRVARSTEYVEGFANVVAANLREERPPLPYELGTAQADAYLCGMSEGRDWWEHRRKDRLGG